MREIILLVFLSAIANNTFSNVPISEYYEYKEEPFMISFVWGVSSGIMLATTINEDKGGNKLVCMPDDVVITNEDSITILEGEIYNSAGKKKYSDETPISIVYLYALENKYPCK